LLKGFFNVFTDVIYALFGGPLQHLLKGFTYIAMVPLDEPEGNIVNVNNKHS